MQMRIAHPKRALIGLLAMIAIIVSCQRLFVNTVYGYGPDPWWMVKPVMSTSTAACLLMISFCILLICHRNKNI